MFLDLVILGSLMYFNGDLIHGATIYPKTPKQAVYDTIHKVIIIDEYQWLEDYEDQDVKDWLARQEIVSRLIIDSLSQRSLLVELFNRVWRYDDRSMPRHVPEGSGSFFTIKKKELERRILCYKDDDRSATEILLDPNQWGQTTLEKYYPSRDGEYLAYATAESGNEQPVISILNMKSRELLKDSLCGWRQGEIAWLPGNKGFYYSANPVKGTVPDNEEFYWHSVYYHELGTSAQHDVKVFWDADNKEYYHFADISEDGKYILYYRSQFNANEVYIQRISEDQAPRPIVTGFDAKYSIGAFDETLFIWTDLNAPNGMVYKTDIKNPEPEHWRVLIPQSNDLLSNIDLIGGHIYATYLHCAYNIIKIFDQNGKFLREISLPALGTSYVKGYWSRPDVWLYFVSFTHPQTIYKYDFVADSLELYFQPEIDLDLRGLAVDQIWYQSYDGIKVSMFILKNKDHRLNGQTPVYLTGYGGFNISIDPFFSSTYAIWVKSGGIIAIPNLRGGGEYGKKWHEDGMLGKKQNVFDDFLSAAEWLIENNYTNPSKLVIGGASNGGLLVGAALVQRPDLFRAVYCGVPLLDMLRYHKFGFSNIWAEEYGNADDPTQFEYLMEYSPYHNVIDSTSYPAVLFIGSENDARCHPLHAMKMAARLQAANPFGQPALIVVQKRSGHGGGTTQSELIEQNADIWAFLMHYAGLQPGVFKKDNKQK